MNLRGIYIFLTWSNFVFALENIALHKTTTMSSRNPYSQWSSDGAVDGNTDQSLEGNSCAVTSDYYRPEAWWKVDLWIISDIKEVKIYYRDENNGNSYTYRLSGFYIYVSNDSASLGSPCYVDNGGNQTNPGPNSITSFPCEATGRYVTIYKSRLNFCEDYKGNKSSCAYLELCEVKVLVPAGEALDQHIVNFALHKTAMMNTSKYPDKWLADAAVDGNTNQTLEGDSCALTSDDFIPIAWWTVDLGAVYTIYQVKIYYRDENDGFHYTFTLSGFYIYVSNDSDALGTACYLDNNGRHTYPGPNSISSFPCDATGRYVTIYKSREYTCRKNERNKNFCARFELCEVEVKGLAYIDNCPNNCLDNICDSAYRCYDCKDGFTGAFCNMICEPGKYGNKCIHTCDRTCEKGRCNHETGECATNCIPGRKGRYCDQECGYKEYGIDCLRTCDNCLDGGCSAETGLCLNGCISGWTGPFCSTPCGYGESGIDCRKTCDNCLDGSCSAETGVCLKGCISGWTGPSCSSPTGNQLIAVVVVLSVGLAILITINVMIIIKLGLFPCRHRNNTSKNQDRNGKDVSANHYTVEMYENPNMNYDSVITDVEDSHTYDPIQTGSHQN